LGLICLDCEDPAGLAAFWAALLGGEVTPVSDDVVVVGNKGTPVAALRVPGYQPPTWPSGEIPKQMHLDLSVGVGDLDAAEAEAIRLGARRADEQPRPRRWRVMLDPAGHPFCLCDWSQALPADRKDLDHGPVTHHQGMNLNLAGAVGRTAGYVRPAGKNEPRQGSSAPREARQVLVVAIGLAIGPLRGTSVGLVAPIEPS
jgi:hypothetical protein